MAFRVDPRLVVEADGVDDERVAFPLADRIAHERRVQIRRMTASVGRDTANQMHVFVQDRDARRVLQDFDRKRRPERARNARRQAAPRRIVFAAMILIRGLCAGPERQRDSAREIRRVGSDPDAGEIAAVRGPERDPFRRAAGERERGSGEQQDDPAHGYPFSLRPSASASVTSRIAAASFFAGYPVTVISSSGFSVVFVHPARLRTLGLSVSMDQFVSVPWASRTSMCTNACGLVHSMTVTTPLSVSSLLVS